MQAHDFESMSVGRILHRTFRMYKDNFVRFVTIVVIIEVPIALLMIISRSIVPRVVPISQETNSEQLMSNAERNVESVNIESLPEHFYDTSKDRPYPSRLVLGAASIVITGILRMLGRILCRGVLTKSVSELYLRNEITFRQAYKFILPKYLTLIGAAVFVVLLVYLGLFLLVIPGVLFGLWFALTAPAIVVENLGATKGISRSKALASGNLVKIFSVIFLTTLITWAFTIPISFSVGYFGRILFSNNIILMAFINQFVSVVVQTVVAPIGAISIILLYYDLRIRKEGFNLAMLAKSC